MPLDAGQVLRHYRLLEKLGEGGMGEVWLARDERLGRDVAVKVLPPGFAADENYRARFEREGQAISALNHPNICTLFDIGRAGETDFLVMERIEGESLGTRLEKGPLSIEQVLETGAQIAAALSAAHRAGIVHRDLKPGNVMLTRDGAKLLDFGLAKTAVEASPLQGLTQAPTQQQPLTQEGTILGTFQYMAPEQLEGLEADARVDIFALGAVLYEMATGRKAFEGSTKTSLIAAIVSSQPPPISDRVPITPPAFEHLVQKCLAKDPEDRWQSAGDVAAQLKWISTQTSQSTAPSAVAAARRSPMRLLPWLAVGVMALVVVVLAVALLTRGGEPQPVYRATLVPPPTTALIPFDELGLSLSPDGGRLAFAANEQDGGKSIWIRDLDTMEARRLPETRGGRYPFWSPDGQNVAFFAEGSVKILDLRGGSPRVIADAPSGRGGTWSRDDVILYSPTTRAAIHRVSSNGGTAEPVTPYDPEKETTNRWPHFLPDGEHFVYISRAVVRDARWSRVS
jgi:predicted Ser/Thr protein kinase